MALDAVHLPPARFVLCFGEILATHECSVSAAPTTTTLRGVPRLPPRATLPGMFLGLTHITLGVPSVPDAEEYYASLFGLEVAFRDVRIDGEWFGLRPWSDWRAADGADAYLSVLHRDALVIVLEDVLGEGGGAQARSEIGLQVNLANLNELRIRVAEHNVDFRENRADLMTFDDRLGFRWHIGIAAYNDPASMGAGERTNRWWPS
jgi:catechol 2,3-dioxygenase-like lactoylglutathione lyase family enzyme